MKTTKFILIVAFLSFATWTISQAFNDHPKNVIEIRLKTAIENPRLVKVMHDQLNTNFLDPTGTEDQIFYAKVRYSRITYVISGTYAEWISFFEENSSDTPPFR